MANQTIQYFKKIVAASPTLRQKEKEILLRRLEGKSLKRIGKKYKLSYERIRQIEEEALKNIKKKEYQLKIID